MFQTMNLLKRKMSMMVNGLNVSFIVLPLGSGLDMGLQNGSIIVLPLNIVRMWNTTKIQGTRISSQNILKLPIRIQRDRKSVV